MITYVSVSCPIQRIGAQETLPLFNIEDGKYFYQKIKQRNVNIYNIKYVWSLLNSLATWCISVRQPMPPQKLYHKIRLLENSQRAQQSFSSKNKNK